MTEIKHTPGPFGFENTHDPAQRFVVTAPHPSGSEYPFYVAREIDNEDDARLFAAAPDMLDALKSLRADCRDVIPTYYLDQIDAAIAKAEGR